MKFMNCAKNTFLIEFLILSQLHIIWLNHKFHGVRNQPATDNSAKEKKKAEYMTHSCPMRAEYQSAGS